MINTSNKSKVLLLIIAILVIANIAMLSFVLGKKDAPRQSNRPDRKAYIAAFLKDDVGFDQEQLQQFDTLSSRHRKNMGLMFDTIRNNKTDQFRQLVMGSFTDSAINAIADQSITHQKAMEMRMLNHIRNVRLLCKPGQLAKFDSGFGKILARRNDKKGKPDSK
ncbi:MAG: hypothetical protein V4725_01185 [Bacteroidota bacterium]|nr:hypothetical protein [Ferruginibacter sp.]